jgi:hypothetical protein
MSLKIEESADGTVDEVSVGIVNRKLEAFVEIVMKKMIDQQQQIKTLKARVTALEKKGV